MNTRRLAWLAAVALALLMVTGVWAQETPEEPETPAAPEVEQEAETPEAPEAAAEPEAEEAAEPEAAAEPEPAAEPEGPPSLVFETTVDFELLQRIPLDGQVGEIEIRGVELTSGAVKGGLFGSGDADLKATLGVRLDCATAADKRRKADLTIHFLSADGTLIDRVQQSIGLKDESKIIEINHTTLKFVVPQIKQVKISAVAKGK